MGRKKLETSGVEYKHKTPSATTAEGRENQLIALAYDLVERRLQEGTATSQETTHFLKLGSTKERLEKEIMEKQKRLLDAKADMIESQKRMESVYAEVLAAMKSYNGISEESPEESDE